MPLPPDASLAPKAERTLTVSPDGRLVEMIELPWHPYFVACQFHPEFTSNPRNGHPLFISFVKAALAHQQEHAK